MFENPFSPIFGGKPGVFFGRDRILKLFDQAMIDVGSDDRALFITGTRGSGKTALLEQLSIRAKDKKKIVIDLGPENTILQLEHSLMGHDEVTKTVSPGAGVNILGVGGSVSAGSVSRTDRIGSGNLQSLFLEACAGSKKGILVTIDEVQKVPIDDASAICNVFQMASRKGYDVMLAVAGLPYAYTKIITHEGCTYLRRASHEELGLFTWDETDAALDTIFSSIKGLSIDKSCIEKMNKSSFGHPYLMQLLGYYLILQLNEKNNDKKHNVTENEVDEAIKSALLSYEKRALKPLLDELSNSERAYLRHMSECLDDDRLASTADIAHGMGMEQNKLSRSRANLIDNGIIAAPERGKVMFCIPYLADYIQTEEQTSDAINVARQRRV